MRHLSSCVAIAAAAWAASPVRAQPGTEAPAAEQVPVGQQGRLDDANIDRGWFMSTAMTQPAGTIAFNDYELLFMGLTWAPADRFQITATALTPIVSEMCCWGILGGKLRVLDAGRLHLAVLGSLLVASVTDIDLYGNGKTPGRSTMWAAMAGGAASLCLDEACRSLFSAFLSTGFNQASAATEWPIVYGASLVAGGQHVKLLLEADSAALIGDVTTAARGAIVTYGVRFTSRNISGDVGFTRPFGENIDMGGLFLGVPILTFTYRAL